MPNYEYRCTAKKCAQLWADIQTVANRDKPTLEPCPHCGRKNCVTRAYETPPTMGADAAVKPTSAFKDKMDAMRSSLGKYNKTVRHNIDKALTHRGTRTGPH